MDNVKDLSGQPEPPPPYDSVQILEGPLQQGQVKTQTQTFRELKEEMDKMNVPNQLQPPPPYDLAQILGGSPQQGQVKMHTQIMSNAYPQQIFNRMDRKYMCCCGCLHVTTATILITILMAFSIATGLALQMLLSVAFAGAGGHGAYLGGLKLSGLLIIISGAVVICLFIGLRKERAKYLIPYIFFHALSVLACLVATILCIVVLDRTGGFIEGSNIANNALIVLTIVFIIYIIIQCWFCWVVYKCYIFFREQAMWYAQKISVVYSG